MGHKLALWQGLFKECLTHRTLVLQKQDFLVILLLLPVHLVTGSLQ